MTQPKTRGPGWNITLALVFLLSYYALRFGVAVHLDAKAAGKWQEYLPILERLSLALFAIMVILAIGKFIEKLIERSRQNAGVRYNLVRLTRLVTYVLIAIIGIAFLFQNLYAAALSFGVISLVLGFALQAPITSFIGWLYIVFRHPYRVGDRIELGNLRGDVLEINYLDTQVRECSGSYLGNDRASGRIIHFPNSIILTAQVINYSGQLEPFIWNETAIQVAYTSDLEFVAEQLRDAADSDFRDKHPEAAEDDANKAAVYFRSNPYAWLEAVVSYPVTPLDTTGRRNRLLGKALPTLNASPDRVQFPQGTAR